MQIVPLVLAMRSNLISRKLAFQVVLHRSSKAQSLSSVNSYCRFVAGVLLWRRGLDYAWCRN